jgi:hypothetical protein
MHNDGALPFDIDECVIYIYILLCVARYGHIHHVLSSKTYQCTECMITVAASLSRRRRISRCNRMCTSETFASIES